MSGYENEGEVMRVMLIAGVGAAALVAGCGQRSIKWDTDEGGDGPLKVVTQLECPEHQGALTRISTAVDGNSCDYAGPQGSQVRLRLVKLERGQAPEDALKPIEAELNALMPGVAVKLAKPDDAEAAATRAETDADKAEVAAEQAAARAEAAADKAEAKAEEAADRAADRADLTSDGDTEVHAPGVSVKTHNDRSQVHLPGIRVDADSKGAHVNVGGIHIDADDHGHGHGSGDVSITSDDGDVSIHARDHAAEIRSRKLGKGLRATYVLADDLTEASGWRLVGYEARGPAVGPIVVAVIKSRGRHDDPVFSAAKRLVIKNVGN